MRNSLIVDLDQDGNLVSLEVSPTVINALLERGRIHKCNKVCEYVQLPNNKLDVYHISEGSTFEDIEDEIAYYDRT